MCIYATAAAATNHIKWYTLNKMQFNEQEITPQKVS